MAQVVKREGTGWPRRNSQTTGIDEKDQISKLIINQAITINRTINL